MGIRLARGTLIKIGLRMGTLSRRVMACDWGGGLGVQLYGKGNGWMEGGWGGGAGYGFVFCMIAAVNALAVSLWLCCWV